MVYVAFVIDVFSRRIVGWKADSTMRTSLVLDTLEMALWVRDHEGQPVGEGEGLIAHHDAGSQYTSFAYTTRLIQAGVDDSVGSVGDAYDNALAETTIGLYKAEVIDRGKPWKTMADVELATLEWVDWYNHLCRPRHKWFYADVLVMPMSFWIDRGGGVLTGFTSA